MPLQDHFGGVGAHDVSVTDIVERNGELRMEVAVSDLSHSARTSTEQRDSEVTRPLHMFTTAHTHRIEHVAACWQALAGMLKAALQVAADSGALKEALQQRGLGHMLPRTGTDQSRVSESTQSRASESTQTLIQMARLRAREEIERELERARQEAHEAARKVFSLPIPHSRSHIHIRTLTHLYAGV
jgi:hypothetical protein